MTIKKIIKDLKKQGKVIPAISDPIFKYIMTEHMDYLAVILNELIGIPKEETLNGKFLMEEMPKNNIKEIGRINDLVFEVENKVINLEANRFNDKKTLLRDEIHFLKLILKEEQKVNASNNKIYQLLFNNFDYKNSGKIIIELKERDEESSIVEEKYTKIHINLENIWKKYYTNKEDLSLLEKYLLILIIEKKVDLKRLSKGDEILENVAKSIINFSEDELLELESELEASLMLKVELNHAEQKGLEAGKIEGKREGKLEGKIEGKLEGAQETKIEIAKNLLKQGFSKEEIKKATKLMEEEIENIINEKN